MLISFAVANFRSIKERQELTMVAAKKDSDLPGNLVSSASTASLGVQLVRSAAILGANASGKSNILKALATFRQLVVMSATAMLPEQHTGAIPFMLDIETRTKPSVFEAIFLIEGVRHEYKVEVSGSIVSHEELITYPKGKPALSYLRSKTADGYEFKAGSAMKGGRELSSKTRPNALLLSVGAQFNHPQLSVIYQWFATRLHYWDLSSMNANTIHASQTALLVHENSKIKSTIEGLLTQADLGIVGVRTRALTVDEIQIPALGEWSDAIRSNVAAGKVIDTRMLHRVNGTEELVDFPLGEESVGTQRFFGLLGQMHQILSLGACILIDELDSSLHPLLVRAVFAMLHDPELNAHGAQAIVTTHDTTLLNQEIIRRDQVWFTEKEPNGATRVHPLTEYKPKQGEALQRGYLAGRYGGVPILPSRLSM